MADKTRILSLYRSLMRESKRVPTYNFREYFLRRVRDAFRENKSLVDREAIKTQMELGVNNLNIIKRQAIIGNLYKADKLVIEKQTG